MAQAFALADRSPIGVTADHGRKVGAHQERPRRESTRPRSNFSGKSGEFNSHELVGSYEMSRTTTSTSSSASATARSRSRGRWGDLDAHALVHGLCEAGFQHYGVHDARGQRVEDGHAHGGDGVVRDVIEMKFIPLPFARP